MDYAACYKMLPKWEKLALEKYKDNLRWMGSSQIASFRESLPESERACFDAALSVQGLSISVYESRLPTRKQLEKVILILNKFNDPKAAQDYFDTVGEWYQGGSPLESPKLQKTLVQHAKTVSKIFPLAEVPPVLYRGLSYLDKVPKENQRVVYTSRKPRYLSGWTSKKKVAYSFGGNGGGWAVLSVQSETVLKHAEFVLWPSLPGAFKSEQEYVLYIKTPMPVKIEDAAF
jgi:hypothetical protein